MTWEMRGSLYGRFKSSKKLFGPIESTPTYTNKYMHVCRTILPIQYFEYIALVAINFTIHFTIVFQWAVSFRSQMHVG